MDESPFGKEAILHVNLIEFALDPEKSSKICSIHP